MTAAAVALLPVALRLALLRTQPAPIARGGDDFSYLLLGDTLAHFRLANPAHPMHRFFEGVFILQQPSYSSVYPLGQGIALAVGELLFGSPWAGVALSIAVLCALCYWMLLAWVTPGWALVGGILCGLEFGPLSTWMNNYWGGAVSGIAGCLVFGALPRISRFGRTRDASLLGAGLGLQMLSRPYEFVMLAVAVLLYFVPGRSIPRRSFAVAALAMLPAAGLTLLDNRAVTGRWTELPAVLSRYQYGVPTTFYFQPAPVPHRALSPEQQVDYELQTATHAADHASLPLYRFFFFTPLLPVLPFFLLALREYRFVWALITIAIFAVGSSLYPFFFPHYIAAETCLFVLISVVALERLRRFSAEAAALILLLCAGHFVYSYAGYFSAPEAPDPEHRAAIYRQLAKSPGQQLVFVRYFPQHGASDWIHNAADIDAAQTVWALDLGPHENAELRRYYPNRTAWLLEPDARPPVLTRLP